MAAQEPHSVEDRRQVQEQQGSIRSYVLRQGRLTPGQKKALSQGLAQFGLDAHLPLNVDKAFEDMGAKQPGQVVVEVGFGNGASLCEMAKADPSTLFLGVEVHKPGVGALLQTVMNQEIKNIRVYLADARLVMEKSLRDAKVDRFQLYFPDPWPKKRHHKRRFVREDMMSLVTETLRNGGVFHMATDWLPYAEEALAFLNQSPVLMNTSQEGGFVPRPSWRPQTKFEQRGLKLGHEVRDLVFKKIKP